MDWEEEEIHKGMFGVYGVVLRFVLKCFQIGMIQDMIIPSISLRPPRVLASICHFQPSPAAHAWSRLDV